jgi:predicted RNase H-like HicB family nuclease
MATDEARYAVDLRWCDDQGCWIAEVPGLRHCSARGSSPEEARREAERTIGLWLEWAHLTETRPVPTSS